jgi:hypothetical protein
MTPIRTTLCFIFLLVSTQTAFSQTSIYGTAALTNYVFDNNNNSAAKSDGGAVIGGMFYNFPIQSRLTAGIDARFTESFGYRGGVSAAAALRIGFVPDRVVLRPYFQIGGGVVSSKYGVNGAYFPGITAPNTRYTNGAVEFAVGLDIRLTDSLDLRAFELGAAADGSTNKTVVGSAFADVGVVYHLHQRPRKP